MKGDLHGKDTVPADVRRRASVVENGLCAANVLVSCTCHRFTMPIIEPKRTYLPGQT